MRSRRRIPLELFAVLETFVIVSLIYAPMPMGTGMGGYSSRTIVLSTTLGAFLALAALSIVLVRFVAFRWVLIVFGAVGILCMGASLFVLQAEPVPQALFFIYGVLLLVGSAFVRLPSAQRRTITEAENENREHEIRDKAA